MLKWESKNPDIVWLKESPYHKGYNDHGGGGSSSVPSSEEE